VAASAWTSPRKSSATRRGSAERTLRLPVLERV